MGWYSNKLEKVKQLSNPNFMLFVIAKALGGLGIGVLLASWLPVWTWWIFIVIAAIIAIPVYRKIFGK